eukprot:m.13034 g.13034  ORF g.13034 m.13034 type:complete len:473 (+) comp4610_c0_seq2:1719-3137(+)
MPGDAADAAQGGAVGLPDTSQREAPPTARLGTVEPTELEGAAVSGAIASAERLSVESPGGVGSKAVRAAGLECIVCVRPSTENLSCPRCAAAFCATCIRAWWKAHPSKHGANCPTCRLDASPQEFQHCPEKQAAANELLNTCECGATYKWGDRLQHVCQLHKACPFNGCDFYGHPDDLDLHTPRCTHALRYSMSLVVQGALIEATQVKQAGVELTPDAHAQILAQAEAVREAAASAPPGPNGSVRHYVQPSDNLQGLAVKYHTTVQEIKRLNRLTSTNLFAVQWIWVPRPPDYSPEKLDVPSVEAMLALRKRELVQTVIKGSKVMMEEAVAYLQLADWNAESAADMARRDKAWAVSSKFERRPQTLADFQRLQVSRVHGGMSCAACMAELGPDRVHCSSCGRICCLACHRYHKENALLVSKQSLGATAPGSDEKMVQVCAECAKACGAPNGAMTSGSAPPRDAKVALHCQSA